MLVTVQLKNTPAAGEQWFLNLYNQSKTQNKIVMDIPVAQAITIDVPADWFPLPVYIYIYKVTKEDVATYQSYDPSFVGWMGEVYITSPGSYYFNCATRQFELISAGVIADITKIEAPLSAIAGESIIVDVSIKNISGTNQYLSVTAAYDSTLIPFQFVYLMVSPGQTVIFRGNFTMPNKGVRITAWGWHWDGTKGVYVHDDTMTFDIALAVVGEPEFAGFGIADYSKI